jgi:hypothetical protein
MRGNKEILDERYREIHGRYSEVRVRDPWEIHRER